MNTPFYFMSVAEFFVYMFPIHFSTISFFCKRRDYFCLNFWKIRLKTKINVGKWDVLTIFIFFIVELNWCWFGTINTLITTNRFIFFFLVEIWGKEWNCVGDDKRVFDRVVYFILLHFILSGMKNIYFFFLVKWFRFFFCRRLVYICSKHQINFILLFFLLFSDFLYKIGIWKVLRCKYFYEYLWNGKYSGIYGF